MFAALVAGCGMASDPVDPPSESDRVDTDNVDTDTVDTDVFDTDPNEVLDVLVCTAESSDHAPHPTCDPTSVTLDIIPPFPPVHTRGCMVGDVCYGPAVMMRPTDFQFVLNQGRDLRSAVACCSQDGVAYRYVTFYDYWSWLTLYYDDDEVLQGVRQSVNMTTGASNYCLNPDGVSATFTGEIWDGKILDHCL